MAIQKTEALSIGKGTLVDQSKTTIITAGPNIILQWSAITNYAPDTLVEYGTTVWRALAINTASVPAITNADWELVYHNCKDGDINIVLSGATSTITQRVSGVWMSYRPNVLSVSLNDGQAVPAAAFTYIGNTAYFNMLTYTVKRGVGENRKRRGTMNILNDGTSTLEYDHEFNEIGPDVTVWLTPVIAGGVVQLQYTSASEGDPITLKYTLDGWN